MMMLPNPDSLRTHILPPCVFNILWLNTGSETSHPARFRVRNPRVHNGQWGVLRPGAVIISPLFQDGDSLNFNCPSLG